MQHPKVSVIVPNYNHARYLPKRINSILDQTFQNFELIILDDCSTDNSREVIQDFADQHRNITVLFNEQNSGSPFKQWNKGVSLARGQYVWIAESDDFAHPRFLEMLVPCLDDCPDVGLAYAQSWVVDENDRVIENKIIWTEALDPVRWRSDYLNNGLDECKRFLFHKPTIPNASAVLFRKETYLKTGMADERFVMCGDWMQWIKMLLIADICFKAEPLSNFRRHSGTTRHIITNDKVLKRIEEEYRILSYILHHVELNQVLREKLLKDYFNRSVNFCPVQLKFSKRFLEFIRIVKEVDLFVYYRLVSYVLKRSATYGPEKLRGKLKP